MRILPIILLFSLNQTFAQDLEMKPLDELINNEEPGWELIESWMSEATNKVEILPRNKKNAETALYQTQVTTRSPMGAIIYETGGILVDHGWIRILGSGSTKLIRSLPEWNKGKSITNYGEPMPYLLIADDAIGGFFVLNGGEFGSEDLGKIYYLSPDNLEWEPLDIGYSQFIHWTFTGDVKSFYEGLRWKNWKKDLKKMNTNKVMNFYPFLWTQYEDLEKLRRKQVPIEEMWFLKLDIIRQLSE